MSTRVTFPYRVFHVTDLELARTRDPEEAAMLVACLGDGSYVKVGRRVVWEEGSEEISAGDSFDTAAATIVSRECGGSDVRTFTWTSAGWVQP